MWFLFFVSAALAQQPACERVGMKDVTSIAAPAVVVLGERKGHPSDLVRAEKIVGKLTRLGPVTVALEAVHRDRQSILDRYAGGGLVPTDLPDLLDWNAYWGFSYFPYERLVTSSVVGAKVVAVGLDPQMRPPETQIPVPAAYMHTLTDAMGDGALPVPLESDFVQMVAWRDHSIASAATDAWDGTGYLVILADRLHVEGGLGVQWQAQRMTDAPVHAFLLAWAETPCYAGDKLFK